MTTTLVLRLTLEGKRFFTVVDDKRDELGWDGDEREEKRLRWEEASGRTVRQVFLARDVTREERAAVKSCETVNAAEDDIGWLIATTSFPPTFHDTPVVSIDPEVCASANPDFWS
jgi:hypothetical protein